MPICACEGTDENIQTHGLKQITDSGELQKLITQVIADNPAQAEEFRSGKEKILGYFVGQIIKQTQRKANPVKINRPLREPLASA